MKNVFLSAAILLLSASLSAQNVRIPDIDFKLLLLADEDINKNGDGQIQESEAKAFKGTINVYEEGLKDLTGIEAFVNLTTLYCGRNSLKKLDLSKNTKLKDLDCSGNNIQELNLASNTKLEVLMCASNQLKQLDLSNNTKLRILMSSYNPLTTIALSSNKGLEEVELDSTYLTEIDFSANKALKKCAIRDARLERLDLSQNPALKFVNCKGNQLKFINLANGNTGKLKTVIYDNNPDLHCIKIDPEEALPNWYKGKFKPSCSE